MPAACTRELRTRYRPDDPGWPWWAAIGVGLLCTTTIGLATALVITKAGVPSFVVTLAGFLIWSGVVLILTTQYSTAGTIRIQDDTVVGIANNFLSEFWGWVLAVVVVVAYAALQLRTALARRAEGLVGKPTVLVVLQTVGLAVVTFAAVWYLNEDRGVPQVILILGILLLFWSFIASRTGGTSTPSVGMRRRRDGLESTSIASGSRSS